MRVNRISKTAYALQSWLNEVHGHVRKFIQFIYLIFTTILILIWLGGCSSKEVTKEGPEGLYGQAEEAFKEESYVTALEKFKEVKNRFPYSTRAVDAELRVADTYFAQESYIEASGSYEVFRELHPTHSKIDYVQYQMGLSHFHQIPDNTSRDLTSAHLAIDAFEVLLEKFPRSAFVEKAKEHILSAKQKLASHEQYVANFYYQRKHFLSASYRYSALLKDYSKLGYDEEALYRLGECYYHIRMFRNARSTWEQLLHEFPDSKFKRSAQSYISDLTRN